ncbi:MBL fold metallo-hydrolase [Propylenella binzhouense]|uniref:MBL fold metallo-hydrolase n=1 Tax=Propylenella binzhouense TaxID=2555902 RepID=A0A964T679_9HYPH|nr:MBL fold metallo-hydrolase [Propylenella binzhouense]MYZ49164.1 MBL fold metallo-hydrolase [Propylenella binzhouense]
MRLDDYTIDVLVQGFPGKAVCHGGLGWSTVALLRGGSRTILVDVGAFGMRKTILERLARHGLKPEDITDVVLTHCHYDHSVNWVTFPAARIFIGGDELDWAQTVPFGQTIVPELYVRELVACERLVRVKAGDVPLPGLVAHPTPGHTPGHLVYVLEGSAHDVIFTGDAAKNRAELVCGEADLTMDARASAESIAFIMELWRKRPGTILIPGHDVPMVLGADGPDYIDERRAGISAWFGDTLEEVTVFEFG